MKATKSTSLRVDPELQEKANKVFHELGLAFNTAINLFLQEVVATQSIPFSLNLEERKARTKRREDNGEEQA